MFYVSCVYTPGCSTNAYPNSLALLANYTLHIFCGLHQCVVPFVMLLNQERLRELPSATCTTKYCFSCSKAVDHLSSKILAHGTSNGQPFHDVDRWLGKQDKRIRCDFPLSTTMRTQNCNPLQPSTRDELKLQPIATLLSGGETLWQLGAVLKAKRFLELGVV